MDRSRSGAQVVSGRAVHIPSITAIELQAACGFSFGEYLNVAHGVLSINLILALAELLETEYVH